MRHKPENVPSRVANTSNVVPAPIRVRFGRGLTSLIHVPEHHLPSVFELRDDDSLYLLVDDADESLRADLELAVRRCPRQAISLVG